MSLTDPIANALTSIRNALKVKKEHVDIPNSKMAREVLGLLKQKGYIDSSKVMEGNTQGVLRVYLKYVNSRPAIRNVTKISKPSRRTYVKATDRTRVLGGLGFAIISTSQGVLTDEEARKRHIGGELICKVW